MLSPELVVLSLLTLSPVVLSSPHDFSGHRHFARDYITPAQRAASYDFVVAGGGLAGLVVASQLSEDPSKKVLVLEAGANGDAVRSQINTPGDTYYASVLGQPGYNWGYTTTPQANAGGRSMTQPRARVLGGSSAINGMYIVRPPATQFNAWRDLIAPDGAEAAAAWGWDSMFEYLKKAETFTPPTDAARTTANMRWSEASHGKSGKLHVTYPGYMVPVTGSWLPSLEAAGVSINGDAYSGDNVGGFFSQSAINPANWTRSYSKSGWIDTLPPRSNLHILTNATVERIVFADELVNGARKATAVRFSSGRGSEVFEVKVDKEVLVAGGAMGTPHMLLVSGVGPKDVLDAAGVPVQVELPGVGQHLMDHLAVSTVYEARTDTQGSIRASNSELSKSPEFKSFINSGIAYINGTLLFDSPQNLATFRSGITERSAETLSTLVPSQYAEVVEGYKAIHDITVNKLYQDDGMVEILLSINAEDRIIVQAALQIPMSQGRVHINSSSIHDPLLIDPGYFSHGADRVVLRQGLKVARRIAGTAPLSAAVGAEVSPGPTVETDDQIDAWLTGNANTEYHPGSTAVMLPRKQGGVVDAKLKVYGTDNVRVVDSSVFPISFTAHLMSPTYALALKAVEIIDTAYKPADSTSTGNTNTGTKPGSTDTTKDGKSGALAFSAVSLSSLSVVVGAVIALLL